MPLRLPPRHRSLGARQLAAHLFCSCQSRQQPEQFWGWPGSPAPAPSTLTEARSRMPAADFDEKVAQALDFIVAEAGRLGIRLTPVLLNTWKAPNGIPSFEKW